MSYYILIDEKCLIIKWVSNENCWNIDIFKVTFYIEKAILISRFQNGALVSSGNAIFIFKFLVK